MPGAVPSTVVNVDDSVATEGPISGGRTEQKVWPGGLGPGGDGRLAIGEPADLSVHSETRGFEGTQQTPTSQRADSGGDRPSTRPDQDGRVDDRCRKATEENRHLLAFMGDRLGCRRVGIELRGGPRQPGRLNRQDSRRNEELTTAVRAPVDEADVEHLLHALRMSVLGRSTPTGDGHRTSRGRVAE
jgi:hypothetical protein